MISGGFNYACEEISYKAASEFVPYKDSGISRYVWIRINDTFLK